MGELVKANRKTPEEKFAEYTAWQGNCLVWTGAKNSNGYGLIHLGSRIQVTHRYSWERENRTIPEGYELNHTCWNRSCVLVSHLELATRSQNASYKSGVRSDSISGLRNVKKVGNSWIVRITKDGVVHHIGTYETDYEAEFAAIQARKELFGKFSGRG